MLNILARPLHLVLATVVMVFAVALPATALNVQPVILDLLASGRRSAAIVTLQNTFTTNVPVEVSASLIELVDNELRPIEGEVEDLLIFPAQAVVAPGESQAFRVQWVGDQEPDQSRHFYVSVRQLPVQLPENENAIQVLYNFKVLVNVASAQARPELLVNSATIQTVDGRSRPVIEVRNTGRAYGYVGRARMTITQTADDGRELFRQTYQPDEIQRAMGLGLIPSGKSRTLTVAVDLPSAEGRLSVALEPVETR